MKSTKTILILSFIPIAIFACGDTDDDSPSTIIHDVVTPEPVEEESDYPAVPEGFPSDNVIWLQDYFDENLHADHVIMYRVAIELWNQGVRGFVNVIGDGIPVREIYLLYPDVLYVTWPNHQKEVDSNGEPLQYLGHNLHTNDHTPKQFVNDAKGKLFTKAEVEEMMAGEGDYIAQYPGLKLVNYSKAGYKPKDVLVDYCNQPGNRARVPYCR